MEGQPTFEQERYQRMLFAGNALAIALSGMRRVLGDTPSQALDALIRQWDEAKRYGEVDVSPSVQR